MPCEEAAHSRLSRFEIFLPINTNTTARIDTIISLVWKRFDGCTFSRYHIPAARVDSTDLYGYFIGCFKSYPKEDVCIISFDVPEQEHLSPVLAGDRAC